MNHSTSTPAKGIPTANTVVSVTANRIPFLQQLDKHARESPEQGKGAHCNHSGRNAELTHGLLQLAVRRG